MFKRLKNYRFWVCLPFILLTYIPFIPCVLLLLIQIFFNTILEILEKVTEASFDFTEKRLFPVKLVKRTVRWVKQND